MVKSLALCIEDLAAGSEGERFVRCVAVPGRQPGISVDETGRLLWQRNAGPACELWVSADGRLVLYRQEGMGPVTVRRSGRSLEAPVGKPVIVMHRDEIEVGGRALRIHVHGEAQTVTAPAALPARSNARGRAARTMATAAMIGAVATSVACSDIQVLDEPPTVVLPTSTPTIEVIEEPPEEAPPPETPVVIAREAVQGVWEVSQAYDVDGERVWLGGTLTIDNDAYRFVAAQDAPRPSPDGALDLLFEEPEGEFVILEWAQPDGASYAAGDAVARCAFRAGSRESGEFWIVYEGYGSLAFADDSAGTYTWRVTRELVRDE